MNGKVTVLGTYNVYIGREILAKLPRLVSLKNYSNIIIITDKLVHKLWFGEIKKFLPKKLKKIILPPGEQSKDIKTIQKIWHQLVLFNCDRKTLIINLGGGVVTDLGGFAAATYMRGVDFLQIPTTLLSQVDASVGGKVGINFEGIKNLIGSFNQPIGVICDIKLLSTLPDKEYISGFGEIIKHGLITDAGYFSFITSKQPREFTEQELTKIIFRSIEIKASIISNDEKERGKRRLLNFGHTIGHAIEALSQKTDTPLLHGEAISLGMVIEIKISLLAGLISNSEANKIIQAVSNIGLPTIPVNFQPKDIMEKIKADKKSEKGEVNWTLLKGIGQAVINQKVSDDIFYQALI